MIPPPPPTPTPLRLRPLCGHLLRKSRSLGPVCFSNLSSPHAVPCSPQGLRVSFHLRGPARALLMAMLGLQDSFPS